MIRYDFIRFSIYKTKNEIWKKNLLTLRSIGRCTVLDCLYQEVIWTKGVDILPICLSRMKRPNYTLALFRVVCDQKEEEYWNVASRLW